MTFMLLSLGRAVVQKAKMRELVTAHLPPTSEEATRYLAHSLSIALVGADPEAPCLPLSVGRPLSSFPMHELLAFAQDLEHAKWAEIPKDAYMAAARFLVTHNVAYQNLDVKEDAAREHFLKLGEAVKAQAVSIVAEEALPAKLPGPAELSDEIVAEGMEESALTRSGEDETLPALHCVAAEVTSADLDVERSCKELAAKIIFLMMKGGKDAGNVEAEVESLQGAAASMSQAELQQRLDDLVRSVDEAEGRVPASTDADPSLKRVQVVYTGSEPLSMYHAEFWQKCFPELFPYGDGVFGIRHATPLTLREWAAYLLERVELEYDVPVAADEQEPVLQGKMAAGQQADPGNTGIGGLHPDGRRNAQTGGIGPVGGATGSAAPDGARSGQTGGIDPVSGATGGAESAGAVQYQPPAIARWRADFNFIAVANDSWKRMELANMVDVFRSSNVHADIKNALLDLHHFSSEIVGSDGARQQLRHEQSGAMLLRGGIDGFLTPNVADVRNPLMVTLHAGCVSHPDGGLDADGLSEKFTVCLLEEEPKMPSTKKMLEGVASNPVAQAQFFIVSMQLFLEHVLGIMPFDEQLRALAVDVRGPMARARLAAWQEATLQAVESIMSSCASLLPLQLREGPILDDVSLSPLPYTAKWQKSDRLDGELEEAVGEQGAVQGEMSLAQEATTPRPAQEATTPRPTLRQDLGGEQGAVQGEMFRRALVPVVEGYVDGHVRRAMEAAGDVPSMETGTKVKVRDLPLTGAVMSRLPHYRLLPCLEGRCGCPICQEKATEYNHLRTGAVQLDVEAAAFRDAFCEDVRTVCCLSGHLHEHQSACFKYAPEGSRRKPQHCRFNFTHVVSLPLTNKETGKTRLRVVARWVWHLIEVISIIKIADARCLMASKRTMYFMAYRFVAHGNDQEASGAAASDVMMGTDQEPVTDIQVSGGVARLRSTSFYEGYLHRGSEEPLASMSLYVYAMHVACVHIRQSGHHVHGEFLFEEHYSKSKTHVQVLQGEPRVPCLHGITVPSRAKVKLTAARRCATVVDLDSVRAFHLPEHSSKLAEGDSLLGLLRKSAFLFRRKVRLRNKETSRGSLRCMPKFSARVTEGILDYVGYVLNGNAEPIILASSPSQLKACRKLCGGDAPVVSLGWHSEQLSAAEYNGFICRNVSANLDMMCEACSRPRPGLLHPKAASDDVGLKGEVVEEEYRDAAEDVAEGDVEPQSALRPELRYKPVLKVQHNDVVSSAHRLELPSGPGRMSSSTKRSAAFIEQFARKYETIRVLLLHSKKYKHVGRRQKRILDMRSEDSADDSDVGHPPKQVAGEAVDGWMEIKSPAAYAMELLQQRLPAPQVGGGYASRNCGGSWASGRGCAELSSSPDSRMHLPLYLAGLARNQALAIKKPTKRRLAALVRRWVRAVLFIDEISLTPPPLLAVLNASAGWGRQEIAALKDVTDFLERPLGDILCQIMSGDFLQLNPVLNHSLMEIVNFGLQSGLKGGYHEDVEGFDLAFSSGEMPQAFGVVISRSPQYENMDASLRLQKQRMYKAGYDVFKKFMSQTVLFRGTHRFKTGDPLARLLEHMRLDGYKQEAPADIRMGVRVLFPRCQRLGQYVRRGKFQSGYSPRCTEDVQHVQANCQPDVFSAIARGPTTMQMTKKVMAPELVQECPCEVLRINFHPQERFGVPGCPPGLSQPPANHPAWETGWLVLDYLLQSITLRIDESEEAGASVYFVIKYCICVFLPCVGLAASPGEDYTGQGLPGVWHLEPVSDDFSMTARQGGQFSVTVTRVQFGLAPSKAGTYNNAQGKTIREADGTALGHCIDFTRPDYFTDEEYTQHVYMILGRARSMQWSLFRNLPTTADGDIDFAVFENGPPAHISEFLRELEAGPALNLRERPWKNVGSCWVSFLDQISFHDRGALRQSLPQNAEGADASAEGIDLARGSAAAKSAGAEGSDLVRGSAAAKSGGAEGFELANSSKKRVPDQQVLSGGGDCFFLATRDGETFGTRLADRISSRVGWDVASRRDFAAVLRRIVAEEVRDWPAAKLLQFLVNSLQREACGRWHDHWSAATYLEASPFGFLLECNDLVHVDATDSGVATDVTSEYVPVGALALSNLQELIARHLECMGDMHWGEHLDVTILEERLNIGFCLFGHRAYGSVTEPDIWIMLHYIQDQHFQVMFLKTNET
ncbi:unnamed protein product [Symbiodinium sp. CCMP2592]|nr:unnamed protein product [Symbiodinium sp. CCMP2592]